jgi:hypothetical protein
LGQIRNEEKNNSIKQPLLITLPNKHGVIAASVVVIGNIGIKMKTGKLKSINLPILTDLDM